GLIHRVGVDRTGGTYGRYGYRGIHTSCPAITIAEIVKCLFRHEQKNDRTGLSAGLQANGAGRGGVVAGILTIDAQDSAAVLDPENETATYGFREYQHPSGPLNIVARTGHRLIEATQGGFCAFINLRALLFGSCVRIR